ANKERVGTDSPRTEEPHEPGQLAADETAVTLSTAETSDEAEPADIAQEAIGESVVDDDVETPPADVVEAEPSATETLATETAATGSSPTETAATESTESPIPIDDVGLRSERFQWKPRKSLRERPKALYAAAIVVLLLALAAQA